MNKKKLMIIKLVYLKFVAQVKPQANTKSKKNTKQNRKCLEFSRFLMATNTQNKNVNKRNNNQRMKNEK